MEERIAELRRRLGEVPSSMMPPAGAAVRGERLATLERVAHERFVDSGT